MTVEPGQTLASLKEILQRATDFSEPWERFHDDVAMAPRFQHEGFSARNERLEACLEAIATRLSGEPCPLVEAMMVHLPEHHFWHGSCQLGRRTVIFFYYDDIDVGLAGLFRGSLEGAVDLARMSIVQVPAGSRISSLGGFTRRAPGPRPKN